MRCFRYIQITISFILLLLIMNCGGGGGGGGDDDDDVIPIVSDCTDFDNDSYYSQSGCGTLVDCNDTNSSINPGQAEDCSDNVDNDCDKLKDCNDNDCSSNPSCTTGQIAKFGTARFDDNYVFGD